MYGKGSHLLVSLVPGRGHVKPTIFGPSRPSSVRRRTSLQRGSKIVLQHKRAAVETPGIECAPLTERYRSGHNGTDSKSVEGITSLRGFESLPLRHKERPSRARAFLFMAE